MSKLLTKTDLLKQLIQLKIPDKYNIYTEINVDGYTSPYILVIGDYESSGKTTEGKVNSLIEHQCEMGIDYSCDDNSATTKEELAIDLEKILTLSGIVPQKHIIWDAQNQNGNTKYVEFKIKL